MKITSEEFDSAMSEALNCNDEREAEWDELINSPLLRHIVYNAEKEYQRGDKTIETLICGFLVIGIVLGGRHAFDGFTPAEQEMANHHPKRGLPQKRWTQNVQLVGAIYTTLCIVIGLCIGLIINHFTR